MKDTIIQGLTQAYGNLVHMIADFLPRFVVMLTIILVGAVGRLSVQKLFWSILHLTKLDRISEQAGASHVLRKAAMPSMSEFLSRSFFWVTAFRIRVAWESAFSRFRNFRNRYRDCFSSCRSYS